jgi:hypothetical protein
MKLWFPVVDCPHPAVSRFGHELVMRATGLDASRLAYRTVWPSKLKARLKGRTEGSPIVDCVVEDRAEHVLVAAA